MHCLARCGTQAEAEGRVWYRGLNLSDINRHHNRVGAVDLMDQGAELGAAPDIASPREAVLEVTLVRSDPQRGFDRDARRS